MKIAGVVLGKLLNRRGAETQRGKERMSGEEELRREHSNLLTEQIFGSAISVHSGLGPGLLESAYEECLCFELSQRRLNFERQVPLPLEYKGVKLDCGYRMDLVVEGLVIVEVKTVERFAPIHEAQLLSYLKLFGRNLGLLINFHVPVLKQGIKRVVNNF